MSNYSNTFNGASKDATNATIFGADFDTEFDNIATMSATKADKVVTPVANNILIMDSSGNLSDGNIQVSALWHSGNDGTGSGLDADLLEGYHGNVWVPVGVIQAFAGSTSPSGWLECDGSAISRTTYADLFAVIGTTFGSGDGSTTFNLPDLRGEFIRGWDNGRGVDASRAFGSNQSDQNRSHTHTATINNAGAHTHNSGLYRNSGVDDGLPNHYLLDGTLTDPIVTSSSGDHTHTITIDNDGGTEARPRNIALMYIIKY